ncbi:MAG: bi-domain-containing oxidoreductase [Candidatus Hydrogenedentes bacterium]|nr:bi-domain-containing oxidoreductase [Candidatus Hydrogenedentota bacterium]
MKQVLLRGGKVQVEDVPAPACAPGMALVRVSHSLISSGTESAAVSGGGAASFLLKKARDPLNVEKLKRKIASVGVKSAMDLVRSKLMEFQPSGYSCAGVIVEVGEGVPGFRVGDRVACAGGGYANHAEYNTIPHQLLTPSPDGVPFEEAAFVALGAIAMQGVRQVMPSFGETYVVLGLGLVGQLTLQIARAAGCRVIGCDPVESKRALAQELGAEAVCDPGALDQVVAEWTGGYGADAVIICAGSKSSTVTNQALDLCRQKGRVSVVGAVGLELQREPLYMKELDFRLSCSYGPGRYHGEYEEKGLDYPIGYVRWTEGRNMSEFLRMIAEGKVKVYPLISRVVPVEKAQEAYAALLDPDQQLISSLLSYGDVTEAPQSTPHVLRLRNEAPASGSIGVAVIGAGGFANAFHLPNLQKISGCHVQAVVARRGSSAKQAGDKFGAKYCTTDFEQVLDDPEVHAVVIATRHNLHKDMAIAAAEAGKHIFVEKPLALTVPDCEEICAAVEKAGVLLSVGFNRRFSPYAQAAKDALRKVDGPKMIVYRCNAGVLPPGHWTQDPEVGGGRIIGEGVHFFDLCCWFLDADPVSVRADRIDTASREIIAEDNLSVLLRYPDGSLATVVYCCLGHPGIPKERIELFGGHGGAVLDDFRGVTFAGWPGKAMKPGKEDKGQYGLLENFIQAVRGEAQLDVTAAHGLRATRIAREALADARGGAA